MALPGGDDPKEMVKLVAAVYLGHTARKLFSPSYQQSGVVETCEDGELLWMAQHPNDFGHHHDMLLARSVSVVADEHVVIGAASIPKEFVSKSPDVPTGFTRKQMPLEGLHVAIRAAQDGSKEVVVTYVCHVEVEGLPFWLPTALVKPSLISGPRDLLLRLRQLVLERLVPPALTHTGESTLRDSPLVGRLTLEGKVHPCTAPFTLLSALGPAPTTTLGANRVPEQPVDQAEGAHAENWVSATHATPGTPAGPARDAATAEAAGAAGGAREGGDAPTKTLAARRDQVKQAAVAASPRPRRGEGGDDVGTPTTASSSDVETETGETRRLYGVAVPH
mmetsp:Transcript_95864/g.219724  ORF Transcript_95864/g.219724 Transcript_95864/m.219724 type:complete len:335 (+) Transcript_95864:491-1495(+)